MRRVRLTFVLNIAIAAWCAPAYAQTNTSTTTRPDPQPAVAETVKEFDKMAANAEQTRRRGAASSMGPKSIFPVLQAIPLFRKATADLREAVGDQKSLRGPLQTLGKLIKPFDEYFKDLKLKPAAFDDQEFKSYTHKDLVWETLTTAERVDNNLQIANKLLRESNRSDVITIKTLQFYGEIDSDLKRLKWLADKVAAQR